MLGGVVWKTLAFLKRDLRIEASYKVAFLLGLVGSVMPVLTFFFLAKIVDSRGDPRLQRYGGDYFSFALVGIAFTQYLMIALRSFASTVRRAQTTGVLEAMLSTQTSPQAVVLYTSSYSFVLATFHMLLVIAVGHLGLGVDLSKANLLAAGSTFVLAVAAFSGLGILSATAIVVLKKGDPIELLIGSASSLLGGAFFPVAVLPGWLRAVSQLLPITHALEAMRLALFTGASIADLQRSLLVLGAMAALLLPASLLAFSRAVEKGRRDGSLMQY